jgi:glyoxylase-like metal-dependent hydrolase (beta-lactamase superfamily II)
MAALTRRNFLAGAALAASGAAATLAPEQVPAAAPFAGKQAAGVYRLKLGDYEVTTAYDGIWLEPLDAKLVANAPFGEVQKALADTFQPTDKLPLPFTPLIVNTGSRLVLIDTGTAGQVADSAGTFGANLVAAGIEPRAIDTILISHFHPDHIDGIRTKDGALVFPNAEICVPAPEWAYWMDDANLNAAPKSRRMFFLNARRIFQDIAKDVRKFSAGEELAPGIGAVAAYGHTPGHSVFAVRSAGAALLVLGDTLTNPYLFLRHPDWQANFDMDGALTVEIRKRLLDRAAAERILVHGYHFPFPALGHVTAIASGYDLVPLMWQPAL